MKGYEPKICKVCEKPVLNSQDHKKPVMELGQINNNVCQCR